MYACLHVHACMSMHACVCVCVCACFYASIYAYIQRERERERDPVHLCVVNDERNCEGVLEYVCTYQIKKKLFVISLLNLDFSR